MLGFRNFSFTGGIPTRIALALGDFGYSRTINNPNPYSISGGDWFSFEMKTSDSYTIVGAHPEDEAAGADSGKAYIFSNSTGSLLHTLSNPNPYSTVVSDNFGIAVDISESYAIVGARGEDEVAGNSSGKAYIYSTSTGSLLYTLNNPNPSANDEFGISVGISENYAIVGVPADAGPTSVASSGRAYIYSTSTGSLLYTLNNPSPNTNDNFGISVAVANNYAIVGAQAETNPSTNTGAAYIYSTSTGSLLHTIDNPATDSDPSDTFGEAVDICDSYSIIGARLADTSDASITSIGAAYIYSNSTGSLLHTLTNSTSPASNDFFGDNVAICENYAIVGARGKDETNFADSGKAYIYSTSTGSLLTTLDNLNAYGSKLSDGFGYSVGISDKYAAVGAYNEDDAGGLGSGKVYMYSRYLNEQTSLPTGSGFELVTTTTSLTSTITIPSFAQEGDLVILADTTTNTANDITPTNFTSLNNVTTTGIRTIVSYKKLESGDAGSTITGNGGTATRKVLLVYRWFGSTISTITPTTNGSQATTAAPTNQTITGSGNKPVLYLAVAGWTTTAPTTSMTGLPTGAGATATTANSTSGVRTLSYVFNSGTNENAFTTATVSMTDGGTNTLQTFKISIS